MNIKVILFDLDGTLLPMDTSKFTNTYFGLLAKKLAPYGYETNKLISSIWSGTVAMIKNDGLQTNEQVFWNHFVKIYGEESKKDYPHFEEFYINDFDKIKPSCGFNSKVPETIKKLKKLGFRLALATNPIFPAIATQKRISWAGLTTNDFEFYTTYENSYHCKPNLEYYKDILNKLNIKAEECLMVGNDVAEDMIASELGINVFLLTDCLINKENKDISNIPNGNFNDLLNYIISSKK